MGTLAPALALALLVSLPAAQGVRRVPADFPTIQSAIVAAQPGDLVLVDPGTYNEQVDFLGKPISVVGLGGAATTTIDGTGLLGWFDFPCQPIVRFVNGESAGSVLQGFTITGHDDVNTFSAPVWSIGATPTLVGCRITGNQGQFAGAFYGSGTLSGCTLSSNVSGQGGAVHGDAQLLDCTLSGNFAIESHGGAINAWPGLRAVRCRITGNNPGTDGRSGGGSFGPAILEDCLIANNSGNSFGGQNLAGASAVQGALLVDGCTIVNNTWDFAGGHAVNATTIVDSILWNNPQNLGVIGSGATTYSNVEGGHAGTGNLDLDPQFLDAPGGDWRLQRTSPCVDAGDPASDPDEDGTRRDMGAFFVPQHTALATPRIGPSGAFGCQAQNTPVIGTTFTLHVTADAGETATFWFVHARLSSPIPTPFGELLVDPTSPRFVLDIVVPMAGVGVHDVPIPNDTDLIGLEAASQAVRVGPVIALTNAVDLRLGL